GEQVFIPNSKFQIPNSAKSSVPGKTDTEQRLGIVTTDGTGGERGATRLGQSLPRGGAGTKKGGRGMAKLRTARWLMGAWLAALAWGGCVQPWVTERLEDKYQHSNDYRTPVMPPIREGFPPPLCQDEPSEQEVLRAMPRVPRAVPF